MQGERRTIRSFPEVFDIGQGSTSRTADIAPQTSLNDILNPVDSQYLDFMTSFTGPTCDNNRDVQRYRGLDSGESSSRLNLQNQVCNDRAKVEHRWSSPFAPPSGTSLRLEERRFRQSNLPFPGRSNPHLDGNLLRRDPVQGSSSSHMIHNVDLNVGYIGNGDDYVQGMNAENHFDAYKSHGLDMEQASSTFTSLDHEGPSSGNARFVMDEDSSDSSSFTSLGSSCKRKALEGSSGHSFLGGSSSTLLDTENSVWSNNNFPRNTSVSTPSMNFPVYDSPVFQNPRSGIGMRGMTSDAIPSTRVGQWTDSSSRNFGRMVIRNDDIPLDLSSGTSGNSNFGPPHHISRTIPSTDSLELRLTACATPSYVSVQNHSSAMNAASFRPSLCNGSNPMVGSSSTLVIPDERAVRGGSNLRISGRNNSERCIFVPAAEMRNSGNDPAAWTVAAGNTSNSRNIASTVRVEPSSNFNTFHAPNFIPHHNGPLRNQQRVSDLTSWSLFPSGSDSGVDSDHFSTSSASSSGSSRGSSLPGRANGQSHHQPYPRASFSLERRTNDFPIATHSLRGFVSDIEGRRRLISEMRQVLNAMRRVENLQAEDHMPFDSFIYHGMTEMHDRHRDMRLDVDNMSYEELLALEERIGDVSTGLSENAIMKAMKRRKYGSLSTLTSADVEPCCICREEYADGEDIGSLDCRHDFHTDCIKQWLMQKNLCPICKTTALCSG